MISNPFRDGVVLDRTNGIEKLQLRVTTSSKMSNAVKIRDGVHATGMKSTNVFRNTGSSILKSSEENSLIVGGVNFH